MWPVVNGDQEVSTKALCPCISSRICREVSLSTTVIGAPQCGQTHSAGGHAAALGGGEVDGGSASSSCRQSGNAAARRRMARKPKKRTRMKPRGNVCRSEEHTSEL